MIIQENRHSLGPCGAVVRYAKDVVEGVLSVSEPKSEELAHSVSSLSKYIFDDDSLKDRLWKFKNYITPIVEVLRPFSADDQIISKLQNLSRDDFEFSKGKYRPVMSYSSCSQVAKIISCLVHKRDSKVWGYTKRKKTDCSIKIIFHLSLGLFYLLPKKTTANCAIGTFKIGRKAICLQKFGKKWVGKEVWHLKGKKGLEHSFFLSRIYETELQYILKSKSLFPELLVDFNKEKKSIINRQAFFELCSQTLLAELVEGKFNTYEKKMAVLKELASLVGHLHANGVVHRDIKPENIVIDGEGKWRLCDLDSVLTAKRRVEEASPKKGTLLCFGTEAYLSSALISYFYQNEPMPKDLFIEEVYALGCVFYALVYDRPLFTKKHDSIEVSEKLSIRFQLKKRAHIAEQRLKISSYLPTEQEVRLKDIVYWMLHPESSSRPAMDDVCKLLTS